MILQRPSAGIVNAMSVDVEDYFQVSAFENTISSKDWDQLPCRVEANTNRILDLFAEHDAKATFFMLGWVAERYPGLVRRIVDSGHELASHGYTHTRVTQQTPEAFSEDIAKTKTLLEDIAGCEVLGYRAASYSIVSKTLWAHDLLQEAGYRYSSSIYPIHHDLYGIPDAPRFPTFPRKKACSRSRLQPCHCSIIIFPVAAADISGCCPTGCRAGRCSTSIKQIDSPACFIFIHGKWIRSSQGSRASAARRSFRHYLNLERMKDRIARLLTDFNWDRMDRVFLPGRESC